MASFKPAYLIHGDDHGRIAERRARLRAVAEAETGAGGVEVLEGDASTPEAAAAAICTLTFATGRRFVVVDGVERWREKDVQTALAGVLESLDPETTVAFFAREDGRAKAPAALVKAVEKAGGSVVAELTVKSWELPKWARARAQELGIEIDSAGASALVAHVGERQQRLLRELEKLALDLGPGAKIGAEEVDALAAQSAERRVWTLADTLVARDREGAVRAYVELREQGERLTSLLYSIVQRMRVAHDVAIRLEAGESSAQVKKTLRMPARAADRLLADVRESDPDRLRRAIETLADLEVDSRGGAAVDEDTAALRAIAAIAT